MIAEMESMSSQLEATSKAKVQTSLNLPVLITSRFKPGPHQQQCRSNIRLRKDENSTQNSFDIVAIFGNTIERCFDIVAGVNGALGLP